MILFIMFVILSIHSFIHSFVAFYLFAVAAIFHKQNNNNNMTKLFLTSKIRSSLFVKSFSQSSNQISKSE